MEEYVGSPILLSVAAISLTPPPDVDLTNLAPKLDNTASDIASHQRDATVQRKELAQKTKDFRKLDDASKLSEVKGLLKCTSTSSHHRCSYTVAVVPPSPS